MESITASTRELPPTEAGLFEASTQIIKLRSVGMSWREIANDTGYSRFQSISLAHNIFGLVSVHAQAARQTILNNR